MQLRLPANILVPSMMLVFCGSTFVELTVSATANNRTTTQSIPGQTSPCASGKESSLPLPGGFLPAKLPEFQAQTQVISQQRKIPNSKLV